MQPTGRARVLVAVTRVRLPLIAAAALVHAIWDASTAVSAGDGVLFARAGAKLFSGSWSHALSDPTIQVGPLHLAFSGTIGGIARALHVSDKLALAVTVEVGSVVALALLVRALWAGDSTRHRVAEMAVCGLWIVWLGGVATAIGQSAESIVPLMWFGAALAARRGRWLTAGVVLGASAAMKAWGILGLPILLLDEDHRHAVLAAVSAVTVAVVAYAPFLVWGSVASFSYHWTVSSASPVHYLLPAGSTFSWGARLLQGALVLGGGCAVAWFARRSPAAPWAVPLAIVIARVLVDPVYYWYYWVPAQTLALVGIVSLVLTARSVRTYAVAALLYGGLFLSTDPPPLLGLVALGACLMALVRTRNSDPDASLIPKRVVVAGPTS
ncbi:MAG: hypothetical protein QOF16_876 [Actinomycetota bacterium]|jgi:hypothetical protein|nr:hypothetical protein [Actinomycetota bacterium]